jgi:hypothetical protein
LRQLLFFKGTPDCVYVSHVALHRPACCKKDGGGHKQRHLQDTLFYGNNIAGSTWDDCSSCFMTFIFFGSLRTYRFSGGFLTPPRMLLTQSWMLLTQSWMLLTQSWMLPTQPRMIFHSTMDASHSTTNASHSTMDASHSTTNALSMMNGGTSCRLQGPPLMLLSQPRMLLTQPWKLLGPLAESQERNIFCTMH